MATFAYEAMNSSGQEVKDEIEATSLRRSHRQKIHGKGFFPTKVQGEKAGQKKVNKKKEEGDSHPQQGSGRCRSRSAASPASSSSTSPASFPPLQDLWLAYLFFAVFADS